MARSLRGLQSVHKEAMKKVRCAVIGAGWWGTTAHIPALKNHPDAELAAVQTLDEIESKRIARDFQIEHAYTSFEELLAIESLNAVVISSTPNMHYSQAKAALEKKLHVLIEKPMTLSAMEAAELVSLADKHKVHFLISCPWHYTQHAVEARELIQTKRLGHLKMVSILMSNFTEGLYRGLPWKEVNSGSGTVREGLDAYVEPGRNSYSDPAIAGGGQIYCQVSHVLAHLLFLTHLEVAEVFARFENGGAPVDLYDILNLKLADDVLVSIASTGATMRSERNYEIRVYGTEGMILMDLWKGSMTFHDAKGQTHSYPPLTEEEIYPLFAPATNLVDVIMGKAVNGSPASLGLEAVKAIEAACQSVRSHTNIILCR